MSFIETLKQKLTATSSNISIGIDSIFSKKKLSKDTLNELEELLICADMGSEVSAKLVAHLQHMKFDRDITTELIKNELAKQIANIFTLNTIATFTCDNPLNVILVCGVNGSGKTTTIGKLANHYISIGKKVAIAACDTFRAAAVEQIETLASRAGALLISGGIAADPASIAYNAVTQCIDKKIDILFIDTAGRLHNHQNLMDELYKITKVLKKIDISIPHYSLLVIDGSTGQNVYNQVEQFSKAANINGLIITKLDGTAKAGSVVGIAQKFAIPIYFIGIGEKQEDFRPFDHVMFSKHLIGLE